MNPTPRTKSISVNSYTYPYIGIKKELTRPSKPNHIDFFKVIEERRSNKDLLPLEENQLDSLLWYSSRTRDAYLDEDYILSKRTAPSAGAVHPIDILINHADDNFFSIYSPFEHGMYRLDFLEEKVQSFIDHISLAFPNRKGTLLWFIIHPYRTDKYYNNFESLVWRDAGALMQTIALTCSALGIGCCPVGTLAKPYINELHNNFEDISSAGGIIIGNI
jgi:SagB-type dehydrogenase family enzyme